MKRCSFTLLAAGLVAGVLALGALGLAAAQRPGPGRPDSAMMPYGQMNGPMMAHHRQIHVAVAQALGMTVEELDAELAAGKTMAQIAQARGVDLAAVQAAARAAHQTAGMPGRMMGRGPWFGAGQGAGAGVCPHWDQP
jgi:hypothetical protein